MNKLISQQSRTTVGYVRITQDNEWRIMFLLHDGIVQLFLNSSSVHLSLRDSTRHLITSSISFSTHFLFTESLPTAALQTDIPTSPYFWKQEIPGNN